MLLFKIEWSAFVPSKRSSEMQTPKSRNKPKILKLEHYWIKNIGFGISLL